MKMKPIIEQKSKVFLKTFLKSLYKYKKQWFGAGFLLLLATLMRLPMPLLTGYIIDKIIVKKNIVQLDLVCGGLVLITIIYLILLYLKDYLLFVAQTAVVIRIRKKLFEKIQMMPLSEIKKRETGYLLARILNDPMSLNGLFFAAFLTLLESLITLIVGVTIILTINWKLALLSISLLPFFAASNFLFIKKIKYWNNKIKEQQAVITKDLSESLKAVKTSKIFLLYARQSVKLLRNLKDEFAFSKKEFKYDYIASTISGFLAAMGPLLVVWYGGHEVIKGNLTVGQLVAFSSLLGFLYSPTKALLSINVNFQKSLVSLNRIFEILNIPSEDETGLEVKSKVQVESFDIEFKNVSYSYDGKNEVLKNLDLKIENNETIAILGSIGAGKSTLINLLALFNDTYGGKIEVGGVDIREMPLNWLRKNIGIVSQEDFLFSDTIYENIKIGNVNASYEDVINAAKHANVYDFIQQLPQKFDTVVGESGEYLSGGQRQLICIARILLRNPRILILDEPTSAIDSNTEQLIRSSLDEFLKNRTAIVISHRLSTILGVDRIAILENGAISDIGNHNELIDRNDFYRKIFFNQVESLTGN